jgi:hypothetical protein
MKKKLYSLQGIIFQKGDFFSLGEKPGIGTAVKIEQAINYGMFHAIVGPSEEDPEILLGHMHDRWGYSVITNFILSDNELSFTKKYSGRPPIYYVFVEKNGNAWHGTYEGVDCGKGTSKCFIIETDESFFDPGMN